MQKLDNEKLKYQLFIGKVSEIIGIEKTLELLKECKNEIDKIKTDENKTNQCTGSTKCSCFNCSNYCCSKANVHLIYCLKMHKESKEVSLKEEGEPTKCVLSINFRLSIWETSKLFQNNQFHS